MNQDQNNRVYCEKEGLIKMTIFIITPPENDKYYHPVKSYMVQDDFSICF